MGFDKQIAIRCFEENPPSSEGRVVVDHWLSLWRDNNLPLRADFAPKGVVKELRSIAIFDVVPDKSVHCRLIGSGLSEGLGRDITGEDWLALTRPEDRPIRLERWSAVTRGAIGRGLRATYRQSGAIQYSEELLLPFGDLPANGVHQVLYHLSWKQTTYDPTRGGVTAVNMLANEFRLIPLA
ncbi:MAG TPA: PAS domain-containing protein [Rhizomicrobium sp.]|jgi:hypothetical protein